MADEVSTQPLVDLWKKQMEEAMQALAKVTGQPPAGDPSALWRLLVTPPIAAWAKPTDQGPMSPDVMAQWKQLVDHSIGAWSRSLEQAMGTDTFAAALGKHLDQWLAQQAARKTGEQLAEATFAALGLPSRSQVTEIGQRQRRLEDQMAGLGEQLRTLGAQLSGALAAFAERDRKTGRPGEAPEAR